MVITYKHYSKPKITRSLDSKQVYYTNLYANLITYVENAF